MKYNEFSGGAKQRHQSQQIVSSPEDSTNGVYQIATLEHCRHVMDCYGMFEIRPCADIGSKKNVQQKSNLMLTTTSLPFNDSHAPTGLPSARTCCAPARWGLMPPDFFSLWQWWTWLFHCIGQLGTNKKRW